MIPSLIPAHFPLMVVAELRKLYRRPATLAALIAAFGLGCAAVAVVAWLQDSGASINGRSLSEVLQVSGVDVAGYALRVRNFFFLPMFLVLSVAASTAGEIADQTMRDALCRPVSRASALWARLLAVQSLSAATLLLTLLPALGGGLALYGLPADPAPATGAPALPAASLPALLAGYACSCLTDLGWISIAALAALYLRSVGGVLVGVLFLLGLDTALRLALKLLAFLQLSWAERAQQFTLGNGLDAWAGWSEGWDPIRFAALALIIAAAQALALRRFRQFDIM